jgi:hypothetical protein
MYGPGAYSGTANLRIQDDIHRAEAYRRSGETRRVRARAGHGRVRSVARGAVAALLWPIKH